MRHAFENYWDHSTECKAEILRLLEQASTLKYPELVYRYTIAKIFENKTTEDHTHTEKQFELGGFSGTGKKLTGTGKKLTGTGKKLTDTGKKLTDTGK